jgi:very-short-patch-repair endonuclease
VLSRRALLALGIDRWEIAAELRARRWQPLGRQTVRVAPGEQQVAIFYRAIAEVGSPAVLDGVSALLAGGLSNWREGAVHVAVPKSATPRHCRGVVVHETRRYEASSVVVGVVPRMRPATAAVHAALWALTDDQAATLVLMAAQQRLFTAAELADEVEKVKWSRRRRLLRDLALAVGGGIETIGEREFARLCAKRGLPAPDRQTRRRTDSGTWVYDNTWDAYGVTVEVDGSQHRDPAAWIPDALKQNAASLGGHVVLRIPNLALRVAPEPFLDQLEAALRAGGWSGGRRSA